MRTLIERVLGKPDTPWNNTDRVAISWDEIQEQHKVEKAWEEALPWYGKALVETEWWIRYGIPRKIDGTTEILYQKWHLLTRGYTNLEIWSYYSQNSERAVKILTWMRDNAHGTPTSLLKNCGDYTGMSDEEAERESEAGVTRWKAILDDMIFFHHCAADNIDFLPEASYQSLRERRPELMDNTLYSKESDEYRRYRRGKFLYLKYYESLWD